MHGAVSPSGQRQLALLPVFQVRSWILTAHFIEGLQATVTLA